VAALFPRHRHVVGHDPAEQVVDPKFELSLLPGPGNPGAAGTIQRVGDFLLSQGIIKNKIDGKSAVDGAYVADYLKTNQ
jgi:hypothetical protein